MPSRKVLKSVIQGFLGTYVSRNSDFDGYLLFGFRHRPPDCRGDRPYRFSTCSRLYDSTARTQSSRPSQVPRTVV